MSVTQAYRDEAVKAGHALPDGSYPIRNVHDLHNAIVLCVSGHGNVAAARRLIIRRARELGHTEMLPANWGAAA